MQDVGCTDYAEGMWCSALKRIFKDFAEVLMGK